MTEERFDLGKKIREKYSEEIENKLHKKVRNCFFLVSGLNGKDYFCFQGNNGSILGICEISGLFTAFESHRWVATI